MGEPSNAGRLSPDCRVLVDGRRLDVAADAALVRAEVDLDTELFGQCALLFVDPRLALINGPLFSSGVKVQVELGFAAQLRTVFDGEVVALEPRFLRDHPPALRVVCQEPLHRLALSQMTRAFNDADDRAIAAAIAQEHGLSGEAPRGTHEHVLQPNLTDAAFLRRRARQHGNTVRIVGNRLVIAAPGSEDSGVTLRPGDGVKRIKLKLRAGQQVGAVSVHGWDPANRREVSARVEPEGNAGEGARAHGGDRTLSMSGDFAPPDPATAESMARGRMRRLSERFATAELELIGDARLTPGKLFTLEDLAGGLDGKYRVEHATHAFDKHGYRLSLRAALVKKKKPPLPQRPSPARPAEGEEGWLENARWGSRDDRAHGDQVEVLVDAHNLEGREVFFRVEHQTGAAWTLLDEVEGVVSGGRARATVQLEHPAVERHLAERHDGAVHGHLAGTRKLRFHASLRRSASRASRTQALRGTLRDARFSVAEAQARDEIELSVRAEDAEGRVVLFRLEVEQAGEWRPLLEARGTVSEGAALARVRLEHPAALALRSGARPAHGEVAGTRRVRCSASLQP